MALTAKQERFAQNIALKGMNQSAAYSEAYDAEKMTPVSINKASSELALHPGVAARIDVLKEGATRAAVKAAAYSRDDAIREAEEARLSALAFGQGAAVISAVKLKADLAGHLAEKKADAKDTLGDMDVTGLLSMREAVEAKIKQSREELEMVGDTPAPQVAVPMRRVI